jgi:hypothetical protein
MRSRFPSIDQSLHTALVEAIFPLLSNAMHIQHGLGLPEQERLLRSWTMLVCADACALARGLRLPQHLRSYAMPLAPSLHKQCLEILHSLAIDWQTMPARTLGDLYELLLNYRLLETKDGIEVVADRAMRKASGSFYTPQPIVESIVAATLKPLLQQQPPQQILSTFSVLDPAMGSGHFLLAAIDYISQQIALQGSQVSRQQLRQQVAERCIYGVDRDPEAVHAAEICIWLHCADPDWQFRSHHLRCGNSLTGPIFSTECDLFQEDSLDWPGHFPHVAARGGFDAIVGNPPYVSQLSPTEQQAVRAWSRTTGRELDAFYLFVERSLDLLRKQGRCGMIIPNVFMLQYNSAAFRRFLLNHTLEAIIDYSFSAFGGVMVPTAVIIVQEGLSPPDHHVVLRTSTGESHSVQQSSFSRLPNQQFNLRLAQMAPLFKRIEECSQALETYAHSHEGIHSGNIRHKLFSREPDHPQAQKMLKGSDITRYHLNWSGWYVYYDKSLIDRKAGDYASLRQELFFQETKILTRQTADHLIATLDQTGYYADNTLHTTQLHPESEISLLYLLALLNSRLLSAIYQIQTGEQGRLLAQVKLVFLRQLPIYSIQFRLTPSERAAQAQKAIKLVQSWLASAKIDQIRALAQEQCAQANQELLHDLMVWLAQKMLDASVLDPLYDQAIDTIVDVLYGVSSQDLLSVSS